MFYEIKVTMISFGIQLNDISPIMKTNTLIIKNKKLMCR